MINPKKSTKVTWSATLLQDLHDVGTTTSVAPDPLVPVVGSTGHRTCVTGATVLTASSDLLSSPHRHGLDLAIPSSGPI